MHTNCQKTLWKKTHLLDLGVDWIHIAYVTVKSQFPVDLGILKTRMWRYRLNSYGL
jgi:hypothetical protein